MVVFAGQGDAHRSMALLWRGELPSGRRSGPGPKPGLSVDAIVDAAVAIADAEGMAALSMRAVGERLGRTAMALYTYVPSKSELLDLMYDRTLAELPSGYPADRGWRAGIEAWAEDFWRFCLRHPWVLQVSQARPVLGPNEYRSMETVLRILGPSGLGPKQLRRVTGALFQFVRGVAQTTAESRQAERETGVGDEEWWRARSAVLDEVAGDLAERYPTLVRLSAEGAFQMEDETRPYLQQEAREAFETGLALLLDGIEAKLGG